MRDIDRLLERAAAQMRHQDLYGAVETLRQALTLDVDDGHAHALLALCLHDQKRLHAAEYEARAALALAPDSAFAHFVMGSIAIGQRRFHVAEEHYLRALEFEPGRASWLRALATLYDLWNRRDEALPLLLKARDADPEDAETWAALADHYRDDREFAEAERCAHRALEIDPENAEALVVMGFLLLSRGQVAEAREHALSVLIHNANHAAAIHLLAAIKARQSFFLGLWWRFNSFISIGSMTRRIVLLIGFYLVYRVAAFTLADMGHKNAVQPLNLSWFAFCVYTWIGPTLFQRSLQRELSTVRLNSKY